MATASFEGYPHKETPLAELEHDDSGFVKRVNEYEYIRELGQGEKTVIYLCSKKGANEREELVVIKSFDKKALRDTSKGSDFFKNRFRQKTGFNRQQSSAFDSVRREIAILKKIKHRNVVRLIDVIDDPSQDTLFIVMEHVGASTVMIWNSRRECYFSPSTGGVLSSRVAAQYLREILSGLAYLHLQKIVHRDLKPENILLSLNGRIKLADFGLGHFLEEDKTGVMKLEGTWYFWSPEICQLFLENKAKNGNKNALNTDAYDAFSADVWAVGVCLFCFLYGTLPFYHRNPSALLAMICQGVIQYPTSPEQLSGTNDATLLNKCFDEMLQRNFRQRVTAKNALKNDWLCELSPQEIEEGCDREKVQVSDVDMEKAIVRKNYLVLITKVRHRLINRLHVARNSLSDKCNENNEKALVMIQKSNSYPDSLYIQHESRKEDLNDENKITKNSVPPALSRTTTIPNSFDEEIAAKSKTPIIPTLKKIDFGDDLDKIDNLKFEGSPVEKIPISKENSGRMSSLRGFSFTKKRGRFSNNTITCGII